MATVVVVVVVCGVCVGRGGEGGEGTDDLTRVFIHTRPQFSATPQRAVPKLSGDWETRTIWTSGNNDLSTSCNCGNTVVTSRTYT